MPLNRRQFLQLSAAAAGSAVLIKLQVDRGKEAPSENILIPGDTLQTAADEKIVPGVCLLCSSGCGVLARVANGRVVKLEGNPMHPINLGALCPKGQAAPELLYNPDRLTGPMKRTGKRGAGHWESITWDEAVREVAAKLNELRQSGHPERAALMYGETRGQLRSFLERFMQVIGSPNAISRDSMNIAAAKLATYLTQGVYDLPAYDMENSAYVLSFGANLLEAGRVPQRTIAGYAFMRRGRAERSKIVIIDPRQGVTGAKADEWIPIVPGTDGALALGIASVIIQSGLLDSSQVLEYGFGFEDFADDMGRLRQGFKSFVLKNFTPDKVEKITGVPAATISRIAGEFATQKPSVAILPAKGGLLNGTFGGVFTAMAIHILNALVGSIETPGGVMTQRYTPAPAFPELPADPVAEKGRESARIDGAGTSFPLARHAYQAVADKILEGEALEMLMLYEANPVFETPGGERFVRAFEKVPFIVSFTSFMDESAQYADLVLPLPTFLERYEDDHIEGLGYPGVALRQPVIEPRHDTRSIGDFLLQVASALGQPISSALPWRNYEEFLRYRLQDVGADFELLKELGVWMTPGYRFTRRGNEKWVNEVVGNQRRNAPRDGRFDFFSRELSVLLEGMSASQREAMGIPIDPLTSGLPHVLPTNYAGEENKYHFVLNVITLMSLGSFSAAANMPTLQEICGMTVGETWDSWLEMNPEAGHELGLEDKDPVWVESPFGKVKTHVRFVAGLHPNVVNLPYNQGHTAVGRWARNRGVNGLELLNPASEPLSGLAAFTNTRVKVTRA